MQKKLIANTYLRCAKLKKILNLSAREQAFNLQHIMSTVKVAINGFGRIGRLVYRQIYKMDGIDVVAINDLTSPKVLAHLLKYDTAQGRFDADVKATENAIVVNGDEIKIYALKNPAEIPWKSHDVDVVLECTGFFTDKA